MSGDDIILEDQITLYFVNNWIQIPKIEFVKRL